MGIVPAYTIDVSPVKILKKKKKKKKNIYIYIYIERYIREKDIVFTFNWLRTLVAMATYICQ